MSNEKIRDEFEAWAIADADSTDKALKFERGVEWYLGRDHQVMNLGWAAWQASRESLVIELPLISENIKNSTDPRDGCYEMGINECREAIEAAALKVAT